MSDLITTIKEVAHRVSEAHLLMGEDMNQVIMKSYDAGEIENDEVMRRICELANQNVYLALFNDPATNKANITFKMADIDSLKANIQKREKAMEAYDAPPKDFRNSLEDSIAAAPKSSVEPALSKTAALHECVARRDQYVNLLNKMQLVKQAAANEASDAFNRMAHDAKVLIANGESIGDLAKLASKRVMEDGIGFEKVAGAYDMIHKQLVNSGFRVKTEFTKLSSYRTNPDAEILQPAVIFATAIEKYAAMENVCNGIAERLAQFDATVKAAARHG